MRRPVVKRIIFLSVIGMVFGTLLAEIPFMLMPQSVTRPPERIVLVIPAGTAQRVALGQQSPTIPQNMSFVVGDTLVVRNEDSVEHQLGPLWIPAGASASLALNTQQKYAFECSFVPSKILGLDVNEPLTFGTRLWGILLGGVPMAIILSIYSLVLWPTPKKEAAA